MRVHYDNSCGTGCIDIMEWNLFKSDAVQCESVCVLEVRRGRGYHLFIRSLAKFGSSAAAAEALAFRSACLLSPSARIRSFLAAESSHSSPAAFRLTGIIKASRNAAANLSIRRVFSIKRSSEICMRMSRCSGGTSSFLPSMASS